MAVKKLFISVPMRGRKWKDVLKSVKQLEEIAQRTWPDDTLEVVSSMVKEKPAKDVKEHLTGLWYTGEALKILARADYFIGINSEQAEKLNFNGCVIEQKCAEYYHLEACKLVDLYLVCPDIPLAEEVIS